MPVKLKDKNLISNCFVLRRFLRILSYFNTFLSNVNIFAVVVVEIKAFWRIADLVAFQLHVIIFIREMEFIQKF